MSTRRGLKTIKNKAPAKKKAKKKKFLRWSYSKYKDYKACPRMAFLKYLNPETKKMDDGNLYTERGERIHKGAEDYINGTRRTLPKELKHFAEDFKHLRKIRKHVLTEKQGVMKENFREIIPNFDFDKAKWWGPDSPWFFCKLDIEYRVPEDPSNAVIVDVKTGKIREAEHEEQLEIYALYVFVKYPDVDTVDSGMWYADENDELERRYTREEDFKRLLKKWTKAPKALLADEKFAPKPSTGFPCSFCKFAKGRSGHCEHGPDAEEAAKIDERMRKKMEKLK